MYFCVRLGMQNAIWIEHLIWWQLKRPVQHLRCKEPPWNCRTQKDLSDRRRLWVVKHKMKAAQTLNWKTQKKPRRRTQLLVAKHNKTLQTCTVLSCSDIRQNNWRTRRRNVFREKQFLQLRLLLLRNLLASCRCVSWGCRFVTHWTCFHVRLRSSTWLSWNELCTPFEKIKNRFPFRTTSTGPLWIPMPTKLFFNEWGMTWSVMCVCNVETNMLIVVLKQVDLLIVRNLFPRHLVSHPTKNQTSCHGTICAWNFNLLCVCVQRLRGWNKFPKPSKAKPVSPDMKFLQKFGNIFKIWETNY